MMLVALVLFVLERYYSPQLAGATAFFSVLPGVLVSPFAGALLDRRGRARLVVLDYAIAALALGLIAGLSALRLLPPPALLAIVGLASLTNPLSSAGARTLFPLIAPHAMWVRANALDSSGHVFATLVASPLAGALVGLAGGEWALAAAACVFASAAAVMLRLPDPVSAGSSEGSIVRNAWRGLVYVLHNPTLRGLALTLGTFNLGSGVLLIALPVLVLDRLHQGPVTVGLLWGGMGAAGLVSALVAGRIANRGRERQLVLAAVVASAAAMAVLPFAGSLPIVVLVVFLLGIVSGPFDIAMFTLRQRRTDAAWFGRAFAVSMSLNYVGIPIGSALAGPLIASSLNAALWVAVAAALIAALFPLLTIPASDLSQPVPEKAPT
jgi:predicted MFS family arabinose efflux permease